MKQNNNIFKLVFWFGILFFALSFNKNTFAQKTHFASTTSANDTMLLRGFVYEEIQGKNERYPIIGAGVYWHGTTTGVITDEFGHFEIAPLPGFDTLAVSFVGFPKTLLPINFADASSINQPITILMQPGLELNKVEVLAQRGSTFISRLSTIKTENVTAQELCRAACCNLSESFQTNATVGVNYADGVTGAKEITMLGLAGRYTQLLSEGMPLMRGLAAPFGLTYVPALWIENIQIAKGSGSVMNGPSSIAGQINTEYIKPDKAERLYLNVFGNSMARLELNANYAHRFKKSPWSTALLFNANTHPIKNDHNEDGFLDSPQLTAYNVLSRWKRDTDKLKIQFALKGLYEDRTGGQTSYDKTQPRTINNGYGIGIETARLEAFGKTGYVFNDKQSIGLQWAGVWHHQTAFFGLQNYDATQKSAYGNLIFQHGHPSSQRHSFTSGLSFAYDAYAENFNQNTANPEEIIPGVFGEYSYSVPKRLTAVLGLRVDHLNNSGWYVLPRMHFKFDLTPQTALRLSGGRGFRTAKIYAENMAIFTTGRTLNITEKLLPEDAWNYGASLVHNFYIERRDGQISLDFFRTNFINQVIVDAYSNSNELRFYNLSGKSIANSFQAEISGEWLPRFTTRLLIN